VDKDYKHFVENFCNELTTQCKIPKEQLLTRIKPEPSMGAILMRHYLNAQAAFRDAVKKRYRKDKSNETTNNDI